MSLDNWLLKPPRTGPNRPAARRSSGPPAQWRPGPGSPPPPARIAPARAPHPSPVPARLAPVPARLAPVPSRAVAPAAPSPAVPEPVVPVPAVPAVAVVPVPIRERFEFIGGMRSLAAGQVVILHYLAAFLPVAAGFAGATHFAWERHFSQSPLFYVFDGYLGVGLFFLLSGFVLAPSFTKSRLGFTGNLVKRCIRLGLPVLVAVALAEGLLLAIPEARHQAATISQSTWLSSLFQGPRSFGYAIKDAMGSMLVGNAGVSVFSQFPALAGRLKPPSLTVANDPALWTLHWEIWGSALLMVVSLAYRRWSGTWLFWLGFGMLTALCGTSFLSLFLVGFALYVGRDQLLNRRTPAAFGAGVVLLAAGMALVIVHPGMAALGRFLDGLPGMRPISAFYFEEELGATLVFTSVLLMPQVRSALSVRPMARFGELSFSMYLLHFPIMVTIAALVFRAAQGLGYLPAVLLAALVGILVAFGAAIPFERWVDRNSSELAGRAGKAVRRALGGPRSTPVTPRSSPRFAGPRPQSQGAKAS